MVSLQFHEAGLQLFHKAFLRDLRGLGGDEQFVAAVLGEDASHALFGFIVDHADLDQVDAVVDKGVQQLVAFLVDMSVGEQLGFGAKHRA